MKVTEIAAWVGAITGPAAILWDFFKWKTSGPRLAVTAWANMVQMPSPPHNPRFLKITVQNVGTTTTTLTNAGFYIYGSRWTKFRCRPFVMRFLHRTRLGKLLGPLKLRAAVLNAYQGPQLPHKLEVGSEWQALMEQSAEFDSWLADKGLRLNIWHSFSKEPKQAIIFHGPTE
jgi:hypothetical protein